MIQNITETKPLRDSDFDISVLNFCNEIAKIFYNSILPDNFDHKYMIKKTINGIPKPINIYFGII